MTLRALKEFFTYLTIKYRVRKNKQMLLIATKYDLEQLNILTSKENALKIFKVYIPTKFLRQIYPRAPLVRYKTQEVKIHGWVFVTPHYRVATLLGSEIEAFVDDIIVAAYNGRLKED